MKSCVVFQIDCTVHSVLFGANDERRVSTHPEIDLLDATSGSTTQAGRG